MFEDFFNRYRVVDLSVLVVPGQAGRRMEIRKGIIPFDETIMHEIDTMSHIGTHIEAPSHFYEGGKDVTELPLSVYMGDAVLVDLDFQEPGGAIDAKLLEHDLGRRIKAEHIVIFRNVGMTFADLNDKPSLTIDGARWLADRNIKMLAFDTTTGLGRTKEEIREAHDILMSKDITLLEVLGHLDQLRSKEFFFMALPWRVKGLDSSPVRAVAFERV